jgi:glutathione reductase (NADPH)
LGTEVTHIIRKDKILRGFDEDLRTTIQEAMVDHGIKLITSSDVTAVEKTEAGLKVHIENSQGSSEIVVADAIGLAATGRIPSLAGLALEKAGVDVVKGAIAVNESSQTSQENIYAVGDCTDRINLTPVAIAEGRAFADTVFGNKPRLMSHENVPSAVFT